VETLFEQIIRLAPSSSSLLVTGDRGVGTEIVSRTVHSLSARSSGPFVAVPCEEIPSDRLESELFGPDPIGFLDASADRPLFESADRGTLFLDQFTEMPLDLQARLLKTIQAIQALGVPEADDRRADVRVIAATDRPLDEALREGRLDPDLYRRLKAGRLVIPPLRERRDDIASLARYFLTRAIDREGIPKRFSDEIIEALEAYHWPENDRELKVAVYAGYLLSEGEVIHPEALPNEIRIATGLGSSPEDAAPDPVGGFAGDGGEFVNDEDARGGTATETATERRAGVKRIVLAEDHGDLLHTMALMLRFKGHKVVTAEDGAQALDLVRKNRPEVVLLDIGMPHVDGYEVARRIRREPWSEGMLLVATTGWGQDRDKEMAFEAGFDAHMTKPVDHDALDGIIRSHRA
jgi:DNA-binding NtrC family response regulator